jgi:hypothetical protein
MNSTAGGSYVMIILLLMSCIVFFITFIVVAICIIIYLVKCQINDRQFVSENPLIYADTEFDSDNELFM